MPHVAIGEDVHGTPQPSCSIEPMQAIHDSPTMVQHVVCLVDTSGLHQLVTSAGRRKLQGLSFSELWWQGWIGLVKLPGSLLVSLMDHIRCLHASDGFYMGMDPGCMPPLMDHIRAENMPRMDVARATPWQIKTKCQLNERNARGTLARSVAMPGPGSHPHGLRWDCPALYSGVGPQEWFACRWTCGSCC